MRKSKLLTMLLALITVLALNAQAQSLSFKIGLFMPEMQSDLWEINMENLVFDKQDMHGQYYGLEYEHFLGRTLSFTIEGSYYDKAHYSFYRFDDGSPIYQNVALNFWAMEAGIKLYPLGHRMRFSPYIGGGGGIYRWKYEQWGDFIDFENEVILEDQYLEASKYTPGFNAKAGFVFRPTRNLGLLLEGRYQFLKGDLSSFFEGFEKLDISGFSISVGFTIYFR